MSNEKSKTLSPASVFLDPGLRILPPTQFRIAPTGKFISYLKSNTKTPQQMDLWRYDIDEKVHTRWINAAAVEIKQGSDVTELSDAERAERERKRQFTFGVTAYNWLGQTEQALVTVNGQAYIVSTDQAKAPRPLSDVEDRQNAYKSSPSGEKISFVRNGDLYIKEIAEDKNAGNIIGKELRITIDASDTISNGLADFLAAEEMHRFDGHWWSPCEQILYYCKVDDGPVEISYRLEIDERGSKTVPQRYPYAGKDNPKISLCEYDLRTATTKMIWQAEENEAYLARVDPLESGLFIQVQDRLQQRLWLKRTRYAECQWQTVHLEQSDTWINLTEDLRQLEDGRILFSTESNGCRQLIVIDQDHKKESLTGPTHINQVLAANETMIFACGWDLNPTENHLFAISQDGTGYQPLTQESGWHDIIFNAKRNIFIDRFTNEQTLMQIDLVDFYDQENNARLFLETINSDHPYREYHDNHSTASFGELAAEDGQPMFYRLTPPSKISGVHPTIIYVYGGPGAQKVKRDWGSLLVQLFAQHGYGVLELDNRGSGNRGRIFEAPIYRSMGTCEIKDQVLGLTVLADTQWADLSRVGIFGHSYGGFMSLMGMCKAADHFKAGVAVAPVSDWSLYDTHYTERYMGLPQENVKGYAESNILNHLQQLRGALLLMHGMADDNVLFTHSTLIMSELQKLNKNFELMTYPGAKHSMQETHISIHRFGLILDFFNKNL
jgi:dipeptidyl-peptidase-4